MILVAIAEYKYKFNLTEPKARGEGEEQGRERGQGKRGVCLDEDKLHRKVHGWHAPTVDTRDTPPTSSAPQPDAKVVIT